MSARAGGFAISGMAILGLSDNFVQLVTDDIGLWQFHFMRSAMVLTIIGAGLVLTGHSVWPKRAWAVGLRSFCIGLAMLLYFGALGSIPVALAAAGLFTSPIFVICLTALMGDPVGPRRLAAIAIGFVGVVMILRPDAGQIDLAALVPVLGGFFYACAAISTRKLCADETTMTLTVGFFFVVGLFGALGLAWLSQYPTDPAINGFFGTGWQPLSWTVSFWVFVQAICAIGGIFLLVRAYQLAEASFVAVFDYSLLVFGGFWAYVLWGDVLGWQAIIGIVLIVMAGLISLKSGQKAPG